MTDDQIWERASIGERVELLRRRLDIVPECIVDTVKAVHAAAAPPTSERIERWKRIEKAAEELAIFMDENKPDEGRTWIDQMQDVRKAVRS